MSSLDIFIICIAVVGSSIIKNGVGVGAGIFMLPFLALVFPPKIALGLGAPVMLIADIVGIRNYWGEWNSKELLLLVPPALVAVVLSGFLVQIVPNNVFKIMVGAAAVLFSSQKLIQMRLDRHNPKGSVNDQPAKTSNALTIAFGFLGGAASTLIHAGGMVMSMYLINKDNDNRRFVGTFVLWFAIINFSKLFAYLHIGILESRVAVMVACLSPLILAGGFIGNYLNKKIPVRSFRVIVLMLIFCIGGRLLATI